MLRAVPDAMGMAFFKLTATKKIAKGRIQVPGQYSSPTVNFSWFANSAKMYSREQRKMREKVKIFRYKYRLSCRQYEQYNLSGVNI